MLWTDAYLSESKDEVIERIVEGLTRLIPPLALKFYITDDDRTLISAMKEHYPNANHQYCIFHIKKNIYGLGSIYGTRGLAKKMSSETLRLLRNLALRVI